MSMGYGNRVIPCSNLKLNRGDSVEHNHCEVECLPLYVLANNTLRCVARGDPTVWAMVNMWVAQRACRRRVA